MKRVLAPLVAVAAAIGIAWGYVGTGPEADGYLLFQPPTEMRLLVPAQGRTIRIDACEAGAEGLTVRGNVDPTRPPIRILVTPASPPGFGLRVGTTVAAQVPLFAGAVEGDFETTIPWATASSRFLVVMPGTPGMTGGAIAETAQREGAGCPSATGS